MLECKISLFSQIMRPFFFKRSGVLSGVEVGMGDEFKGSA
jgi:hypothetical protein